MEAIETTAPKPVLGFVILSHSTTAPLTPLISTLNRIYSNPPIVIHHDFSQCLLPTLGDLLGSNITIVHPHLRTRWAHMSIVDAFLVGLEILFQKYSPDWFTLLSAGCFPVAKAEHVLGELATTRYDAYMQSMEVQLQTPLSCRHSWRLSD